MGDHVISEKNILCLWTKQWSTLIPVTVHVSGSLIMP